MTINYYKKGQKIRITCIFQVWNEETQEWERVDPTTVICKIMHPNQQVDIYRYGVDDELVRESVGDYHLDVVGSEVEEWPYRFEGTGTCEAVEEGVFGIRTLFPN